MARSGWLRWRQGREDGQGLSSGLPASGFSLAGFRSDLMAGLTFAVVNVPQSMAHALLAAVNPVFGIHTLIVALPIGALFTSSVFMNVSTTSSLCVATGAALDGFAPAERAQALVSLVFLVGVIQLLAGAFRLGFLVRFVSHAVMTGFLNGVAVLIVLGQLGTLTAFHSLRGNQVAKAVDLVANLGQVEPHATAVGLGTLAVIAGLTFTRVRRYAFLVGVVGATAAVWLLGWQSVGLVGGVARIPRTLPAFTPPELSQLPALVLAAVSVAIVGLMQGAGVSQGYSNPDGKRPNASRDFLGQGAANLAAGLFQGLPAGGSISGTGVIVSAGARSRWSNILAGLFVAGLILPVAPAVERVPMPALAALLVVAGCQALRLRAARMAWRTGAVSKTAMGLTFASTLLIPLHYAVLVGVAFHILLHVAGQADRIVVTELVLRPGELPEERPAPRQLTSGKTTVLQVYGSLFWAAATSFEAMLPSAEHIHRAAVVLVLRGHREVGATFFNVLTGYALELAAGGNRLLVAGVDESVCEQLRNTGALAVLGEANVYPATARFGEALLCATRAAKAWQDAVAPADELLS